MRQFIPLDLRNIKDINVRSQLRKLNDWLSDLAATLSDGLIPAPGSNTTINNQVINPPDEETTVSGLDAKALPYFFEDFIGSAVVVDASTFVWDHLWKFDATAGGAIGASQDETDPTAIGVLRIISPTTNPSGASISDATTSDPSAGSFRLEQTGLRIKFRFRVHPTEFTRGMLYLGLTNDPTFPGSGTGAQEEIIFGLWATDESPSFDYATVNEGSIAFFACRNGGTLTYTVVPGIVPLGFTGFHTAMLEFTSDSSVACYLDDVLVATLTTNLPSPSTQLYCKCAVFTRGTNPPAVSQKGYVDVVKIDGPTIDRGLS